MNILLLIIFYLLKSIHGNRYAKLDYEMNKLKETCNKNTCNHIKYTEEAQNCINSCMSLLCYEEIYGNNPLEDGEIDLIRQRLFQTCVRKEIRVLIVSKYQYIHYIHSSSFTFTYLHIFIYLMELFDVCYLIRETG